MTSDDIHRHLPLRPVVFAVLLVLRAEPAHGFGIMERANGHLGEHVLVGPGTLYRTLKEMRAAGYVEHADPPAGESGTDGRRQYYRLTSRGLAVCDAEARRIAALLTGSDLGHLLPDTSR